MTALDLWRPTRHLMNLDESVRRVLREPALRSMNGGRA